MAAPVPFKKPWFKSQKKRSSAGWVETFARKAAGQGRRGGRKPGPKPPKGPGPGAADGGLPADPPDKPKNPPLAGGAAASLDRGDETASN